jgi:hypothetical protein
MSLKLVFYGGFRYMSSSYWSAHENLGTVQLEGISGQLNLCTGIMCCNAE